MAPADVTKISDRPKSRMGAIRALAAAVFQARANAISSMSTFGGRRNINDALGYTVEISPEQYRARYDRNAVAARIIEAKPQSTWRGGGEIIEDESPEIETSFEKAWNELATRLKVWSVFQRADILAGMQEYAAILIAAPGGFDTPLEKAKLNEIFYLTPYAADEALIDEYDTDIHSPRCGEPLFYNFTRVVPEKGIVKSAKNSQLTGKRVHYTRVIHIADGLLDDRVCGVPRLKRCWNLLDDLEKVTGGGAEAFWLRANAGLQVDVDKDMELTPDAEQELEEEVDRYLHNMDRVIKTRGTKMTPLSSSVAGIKDPIEGIMSQISAGTGIPQRILMGSERGQLASTQDDDNWTQRIVDRRRDFAGPQVVVPFVDRMIAIGALPKPEKYDTRWPELDNLDEVQKASVAQQWADVNKKTGKTVVLPSEFRDRLLGLPAIPDEILNPPLPTVTEVPIEGKPAPVIEGRLALPPGSPAKATAAVMQRKWRVMSTGERRRFLTSKGIKVEIPPAIESLAKPEPPDNSEIRALRQEIASKPVVNVELPSISINMPSDESPAPGPTKVTRMISYEKIDGLMRPVRITEEK